jgi:hypothetical protein
MTGQRWVEHLDEQKDTGNLEGARLIANDVRGSRIVSDLRKVDLVALAETYLETHAGGDASGFLDWIERSTRKAAS